MTSRKRVVVGVSGSSGPQFAAALLGALRTVPDVESHLVISAAAVESLRLEMRAPPSVLTDLADCVYDQTNLGAPISSGSFPTMGMVVIPCSMRSLAAIATGNTSDLLTRAADVTLKERRRLVLVVRETPLSLIHIRNMETVTLAGATVLPPVPAFYHYPESIDDLLRHVAGKVLDQFEIKHDLYRRWIGEEQEQEQT